MQIVTGFGSEFTAEEKTPRLLGDEYAKMLKALKHNQEVAENVFARTAKSQFKELVGHKVLRIRLDEVREGAPQWFSESAVTLDLEMELRSYDLTGVGCRIATTVHDFGGYILGAVEKGKVLVDSLNTKIIRSGESLYQFRLKQRWVAGD